MISGLILDAANIEAYLQRIAQLFVFQSITVSYILANYDFSITGLVY